LIVEVLDSVFDKNDIETHVLNAHLRLFIENEMRNNIVKQMITLLENYIAIEITEQKYVNDVLYIYCDYKIFESIYELEIKKSYNFNRLYEEKNTFRQEQNEEFSKRMQKIAIEKDSSLQLLDRRLFRDVFQLSDVMKDTIITEFKNTAYYKMTSLYDPDFKKIFL
jgi:hypothetical protein